MLRGLSPQTKNAGYVPAVKVLLMRLGSVDGLGAEYFDDVLVSVFSLLELVLNYALQTLTIWLCHAHALCLSVFIRHH